MAPRISSIVLWLFVINLGIVFGAGLYETRIEFTQWLTVSQNGEMHWNSEAAKASDTGLRFWVFSSTIGRRCKVARHDRHKPNAKRSGKYSASNAYTMFHEARPYL